MEAPATGRDRGDFAPLWAHDSAQEREALIAFMDYVAARRATHPDLHIYHYAPYETAALKRLVSRHQTHEEALDDLLRSGVFVDLYATVRGSVRVSQPSYSIKKLEPLYMGQEIREGDVQAGDASVVEYHEFRALRDSDPAQAAAKLTALADYNEYDCLSTLRLRDWLLARAGDAGVADRIKPRVTTYTATESSDEDSLFLGLMAKAEPAAGAAQTVEQQAYALLATSLDYYRREERPFWWDHFARLKVPADEWSPTRDVFLVESVEILADWHTPQGKRIPRRELRLTGDWGPGSTLQGNRPRRLRAARPGSSFGPRGQSARRLRQGGLRLRSDQPAGREPRRDRGSGGDPLHGPGRLDPRWAPQQQVHRPGHPHGRDRSRRRVASAGDRRPAAAAPPAAP